MAGMLVIADDFTGALDTGIQFTKKGIRTQIILDGDYRLGQAGTDDQVIVVDSETRHLSPEEAARRVREIVRVTRESGVGIVYKKTDSALRGNIGSELEAQLEASGRAELFYIPAFPKAGRTTVGGVQYVDGVPVSESVFGKDPFEPVKSSYIPDIIASQSGAKVKVLASDDLKKGLAAGDGLDGKSTIYVVDAETDEDLKMIAAKMREMGVTYLAGCAGFAEFLQIPWEKEEDISLGAMAGEGVIVVSGSMNPITFGQIRKAREAGICCVTMDDRQKMSPKFRDTREFRELVDEIISTYEREKKVIVEAVDSLGCAKGEVNLWDARPQARQQVAENVAEIVNALITGGVRGIYVLIGGDTMATIMRRIGCRKIVPLKELMPGIVLSKAYHETGKTFVISKSGGLGEETALVRLLQGMALRPALGAIR